MPVVPFWFYRFVMTVGEIVIGLSLLFLLTFLIGKAWRSTAFYARYFPYQLEAIKRYMKDRHAGEQKNG